MLQIVTTDDIPKFKIHNKDRFYLVGRCFRRRIFCKILDICFIGSLQYKIDTKTQIITIYIKLTQDRDSLELVLKQYQYAPGTNIRMFLSIIKKEFLNTMPQIEDCKWSFFIEELF